MLCLHVSLWLLINVILAKGFTSFVPYSTSSVSSVRRFVFNDARSPVEEARSKLICSSKIIASLLLLSTAQPAAAKVFIDTDLYGDKELKIATINKLKQKLRDAILNDVTLAPLLLQLAINDALGYDAISEDGGPDGSVQFELMKEENKGLEKAVKVVQDVKKSLQRTNTVSFADIVAFGGAEALETAGCSRLTVQIGRDDAKAANTAGKAVDWESSQIDAKKTRVAFDSAGLEAKDLALLFGALGEVRRVMTETLATKEEASDEESDVDEGDVDFEKIVPSSFGSRDATFGKKMGKGNFGTTYLSKIVKGKADGDDNLRSVFQGDTQVMEAAKKYASSQTAFLKDLQESYLKLTLLGQAYSTRNS